MYTPPPVLDVVASRGAGRSCATIDFGAFQGLSDLTVRQRLSTEGPNEVPASKARGAFRIAFEVAKQPMFMLLVGAGALYLAVGKPTDALVLLAFVFVVMGITIIQERRTERALDALRDLSSPRALVVRMGRRQRIAGRDVVRGDILLLNEGDRVPADAILRSSSNLSADESLLTGESAPVCKRPSRDLRQLGRPRGDELASIFAGTLITSGQGIAEVVATGVRSELGKVGTSLQSIELESTPLQRETERIVSILATGGLAACAAVTVCYALTRGGAWQVWKDGLLAGIAMAMAILPEEFPVILTVFLAFGAWRISHSQVLTRRLAVIETLGAATVLCVDKTGTLTQNRMTLRIVESEAAAAEVNEELHALSDGLDAVLQSAVLASKPEPFDPMERALQSAHDQLTPGFKGALSDWEMIREYPLMPELMAVSHVWRTGHDGSIVVASKGAPEAIAELCRLSPDRRRDISAQAKRIASSGLRVLAVARTQFTARELPAEHAQLAQQFLGFVAFEDPVRKSVPTAVAECRAAGIRVIMITGDYPETARSIAHQAGLSQPELVITGKDLESMSDSELADRIREAQVFARVLPEQKLRIVRALKANSEVVAMTGDGVNDAPALKAAHIGIAMGGRGTDVAREAASLVLLDDDFSSIVATVKLGRRIYDNIRKAIAFTIAVHVPIAGLSIVPVLLPGWPLLLLPVHIAFLELIIDPSCSLIFEAEQAEAGIMNRPPRSASERLFNAQMLGPAVIQGLAALGVCLTVVFLALPSHGPDGARALSFATLVVSFLVIILTNRSWTRSVLSMMREPNAALWWVLLGTAIALSAILTLPPLQRLFSFSLLHLSDLAASVIAVILCLILLELFKRRSPPKQTWPSSQ